MWCCKFILQSELQFTRLRLAAQSHERISTDVEFQLLNSSGSSLSYFKFHNAANVFNKWQVWTAGRSVSTQTLSLQIHAVGICAQCGLVLCCWNKQGRPEKDIVSKDLYISFSINGALTNVQVTNNPLCTNAPPYHHGWSLSFSAWSTRCPWFPNRI